MSADFVKIKSVPKLAVSLVITMSDTSTKTMIIREGDRVTNLSYITNGGKVETITGDVKVIKFTASSRQTQQECVHNVTSDFAARVSVTDLVVDCSDVYKSDIRVIPVSSIRGFESDDLGEMIISDVKIISLSEVSFVSSVPPVAAIWNGESYMPTQEDPNVPVYTVTVNTMKKMNTLIVLDADNRCKLSIPGIEPEVVIGSELTSTLNSSVENFISTYFNKVSDNLDVEVPDEEFYITVAKNVTDTDKITIGDIEYVAGTSIMLNIGNGSRVNKEAFKFEDNTLKVSPFVMILQSDEYGSVDIYVNDFTLSCLTGMTQERLSISGVEAIGGKPSCDNVVVMEDETINHIRQDGSAGVKVSLDGSNDDITGKTFLVRSDFSEDDYGIEYSIVSLDEKSLVLPESDLEGYVSTDKIYTSNHKIASINGYGSTEVTITTTEVSYERQTEFTVGSSGCDYETIADALPVLEDGDTLTLSAGTYSEPISITKAVNIVGAPGEKVQIGAPMSISADRGSVLLKNLAISRIESSDGTGFDNLTAKGNAVEITGGCDVTLNNVTVTEVDNFYNVINIDTTGRVEITECEFDECDSYRMIEIASDNGIVKDGTIIQNTVFGKVTENTISMYKFEENAVVTIKDCVFKKSSNAVRVSNASDVNATINFENITYLETNEAPNDGLLILQDDANDDYSKFILNFKNVAYSPLSGVRTVFSDRTDEVGGQLWYICRKDDQPYTKGQPNASYSA